MGTNTKSHTQLNIDGEKVAVSNLDKVIWPQKSITKYEYLKFLTTVAPYMVPFLKDRLLTVIRFPDGVEQESFYQKNCPEYAPEYIETKLQGDINYIICSKLSSLIWLGNQAAVEFHIPFQTVNNHNPSEIVLDLDPPSQSEFSLAVEASLILKEIFDKLQLHSFIKTSGNKGLQIYLPLNEQFSYDETRIFTSFIAHYLETKYPKSFTTERLKKNRHKRLYVDFLQHGEGKTIIAPYSLRGNGEALMATPLHWSEVNERLHPSQFPLEEGIARINNGILPFDNYFEAKKKQPFKKVLEIIMQ
ncbi:non-homologous end-joining DNA ligase [Anaerobacillus arseniciselenatis]|uniref:non-homologous end-joining DNA ligase n=1 Tax=Anaerobacillus arseniciselenatis TaxID=85682 RepID=UPI000ABDA2DB|nr:non-homologous end-joining DNA ligase [Anaerobacillus arseniciselenatis]